MTEIREGQVKAVERQFDSQAEAYLNSNVHASGKDLQNLADLLASSPRARLLDLGCGAGHVSFTEAPLVADVVAYDLSASMLDTVSRTAGERGYENIRIHQGYAEALPFETASFDAVVSRYSAHHWQDVGLALREAHRVLKKGGIFVLIDVVSPGQAVLDIYLQTVEMLRDTSHVRDYSAGEWLHFLEEAGLMVEGGERGRLELEFQSWVERMRTPQSLAQAIRDIQRSISPETADYFALKKDGSFSVDTLMVTARKV